MADLFSKLPIDILTRLPLKTISNCRYISKSWYNFILNPSFAQLHFARHKHDFPCAIFPTRYGTSYLIDSESLSKHETSVIAYDLDLKKFRENFRISDGCYAMFEVVGTVNGLVCFAPERNDYEKTCYYVVNPITKDYILVPKSPLMNLEPVVSGFGFDSIENEYKVVRILPNRSEAEAEYANDEVKYGNRVEIYTMGSGTWREIQLTTLTIVCLHEFNVLLHGCLHGISRIKNESENREIIISFDMTREEFGLIQMPPRCGQGDKDLWVMKIYGVHSSWVKEYIVKPTIYHGYYHGNWHGYHEVMRQKNNELLLIDGKGDLFNYD